MFSQAVTERSGGVLLGVCPAPRRHSNRCETAGNPGAGRGRARRGRDLRPIAAELDREVRRRMWERFKEAARETDDT